MQKKKLSGAAVKKPQLVPGMNDLLPETAPLWDLIFRRFQKYAINFGFKRVQTPLLESANFFDENSERAVAFNSASGDNLFLRGDVLPALLRAYSDYKKPEAHRFSKWYYISEIARNDLKHKNCNTDWQFGLELLGQFPLISEIQLIAAIWKFYSSFGFQDLNLEINNIGNNAERGDYERALIDFLQTKKYELCNDCVSLMEQYPLQVFRCASLSCRAALQEAPQIIDYLSEVAHRSFTHSLETLDELGVSYSLNPALVGEIGSSGTVFTFKIRIQDQDYILGQGSGHSDLTKMILGRDFYAFGFRSDFSVLQKAIEQAEAALIEEYRAEVFLAPLGDLAIKKATRLFSELWDADIYVYDSFGDGGVKSQLKLAEAARAVIALIIGQKEAMDDMVILRDVKSGMQEVFQHDRIIEEVKKRLGK